MKKLFTLICVFICVLAGAQTSDSVAVWQNGKATMFARASVDSITFVKGINPLDTMFVDMGVSVKWAKVNIGATTETEFGSFFSGAIRSLSRSVRGIIINGMRGLMTVMRVTPSML